MKNLYAKARNRRERMELDELIPCLWEQVRVERERIEAGAWPRPIALRYDTLRALLTRLDEQSAEIDALKDIKELISNLNPEQRSSLLHQTETRRRAWQ